MKMKKGLILLGVFGFLGWFVWSCGSVVSYSEIPEIHFKSLVFEDRVESESSVTRYAVLTFSFIDGDGDIGASSQDKDTISRIHYTWYKKLADKYEPFQFASGIIADSTAIPYEDVMNKEEANNKTLKGTIEIALFPPSKPQGIDTMRVEFYIVDRARNKSNIDYTSDFSILNPPFTSIP